MNRYARPVLALIFVAMLATPAAVRRFGAGVPAELHAGDPQSRYGFTLSQSAAQAGIDFLHEGPTLDQKLAHIMPQVASMGAAVSIVDVDVAVGLARFRSCRTACSMARRVFSVSSAWRWWASSPRASAEYAVKVAPSTTSEMTHTISTSMSEKPAWRS